MSEKVRKPGELPADLAARVAEGRSISLKPNTPEEMRRRQEAAIKILVGPADGLAGSGKRFAITRGLEK